MGMGVCWAPAACRVLRDHRREQAVGSAQQHAKDHEPCGCAVELCARADAAAGRECCHIQEPPARRTAGRGNRGGTAQLPAEAPIKDADRCELEGASWRLFHVRHCVCCDRWVVCDCCAAAAAAATAVSLAARQLQLAGACAGGLGFRGFALGPA